MNSMTTFRLDRAISVGLVHPFSHIFRRRHALRVPILMYHGLGSEIGRRHPYFETNTSQELFAAHMKYLRDNGYTTVNLNEALEAMMTGRNSAKRVVITFDDGFRDFYTRAFPILAEYNFKASMFIVSGLTGNQTVRAEGKEYLTWGEVREIHSRGIQIGSHTASHPELYKLSLNEVEYEVRQSKETIEDELGDAVRSFSYPYAFPEQDKVFIGRLQELLQTHGYENGISTILGTANLDDNMFFLPRLPVNSFDDLGLFAAKLEGGYDWLHAPQYFAKQIKRLFGVRIIPNDGAVRNS
jgi:peptidoglycan/xylan/chitin deacetylase (PgdA/CDA1 family)